MLYRTTEPTHNPPGAQSSVRRRTRRLVSSAAQHKELITPSARRMRNTPRQHLTGPAWNVLVNVYVGSGNMFDAYRRRATRPKCLYFRRAAYILIYFSGTCLRCSWLVRHSHLNHKRKHTYTHKHSVCDDGEKTRWVEQVELARRPQMLMFVLFWSLIQKRLPSDWELNFLVRSLFEICVENRSSSGVGVALFL